MKKLLVTLLAGIFALGMMGAAHAAMVSFVNPFSNAGSTVGWSTGDNEVNLGISSFSILGGLGTVSGYLGADPYSITQRGTRGLGIAGGTPGDNTDEVDSDTIGAQEHMEINFSRPMYLRYLELRSLFNPEGTAEQADVYYYYGDTLVGQDHLFGEIPLGTGVGLESVNPGLRVTDIRFQVDLSNPNVRNSDFAIAKLDASPIPEPVSAVLLGMGLLGLFGLRRKNA